MTRINLSDYGSSPFEKLIGHNKKVLDKWIELENAFFAELFAIDHKSINDSHFDVFKRGIYTRRNFRTVFVY